MDGGTFNVTVNVSGRIMTIFGLVMHRDKLSDYYNANFLIVPSDKDNGQITATMTLTIDGIKSHVSRTYDIQTLLDMGPQSGEKYIETRALAMMADLLDMHTKKLEGEKAEGDRFDAI